MSSEEKSKLGGEGLKKWSKKLFGDTISNSPFSGVLPQPINLSRYHFFVERFKV